VAGYRQFVAEWAAGTFETPTGSDLLVAERIDFLDAERASVAAQRGPVTTPARRRPGSPYRGRGRLRR
jgi:hypothetical protein